MVNSLITHDPPQILVVDDNATMRKLIRRAMEIEGYQVIEAKNGQEAITLYSQQNPDIILLDAMMPVMDGFTCCQKIHALSCSHLPPISQQAEWETSPHSVNSLLASLARKPILMITALEDTESVNRAFEVGATDYITKPIHWAVLQHRVRRLIERSHLYQQLELANKELHRLANLDGLTQLANRRRFDEYLEREWRRMVRDQTWLSLILCDIDFFKSYNDTYGHQAGDTCLQKVARVIQEEAKRPADLAARYGGEEMAVILPGTDSEGAFKVSQRIYKAVKELGLEHSASSICHCVTLSLGVTSMIPMSHISPNVLIKQADQALYRAKEAGRDCIEVANNE